MNVLLVNANLMRPPVPPVALDLLADSLACAGFTPVLRNQRYEVLAVL